MNRFAWPTLAAGALGRLQQALNQRMKGLEHFLQPISRVTDTGTAAQQGYALEGVFLEFDELSGDASAPDSDKGRLYMTDDGAGKTQLVVRFPTGAVQVIATEP